MPAKKRAQRAPERLLRPGSEHFEIFFENAPVMMSFLDQKARHLRVNRRWREVLGYEPEDVIGKNVSAIMTDAGYEQFRNEDFPDFWRRGYAEDRSYDVIAKDGEVIPIVADVEAIVDSEGNRLVLGIARPAAEAGRERSTAMLSVVEELEAIAL